MPMTVCLKTSPWWGRPENLACTPAGGRSLGLAVAWQPHPWLPCGNKMYNTTQIGLLLTFANPGLRGWGQVGGGVPSGFRGLHLGLLISSAQPSRADPGGGNASSLAAALSPGGLGL